MPPSPPPLGSRVRVRPAPGRSGWADNLLGVVVEHFADSTVAGAAPVGPEGRLSWVQLDGHAHRMVFEPGRLEVIR